MTNLLIHSIVVLVDNTLSRVLNVQNKYLIVSVSNKKPLVGVKGNFLDKSDVFEGLTYLSSEDNIVLGVVGGIIQSLQFAYEIFNLILINLANFESLCLLKIYGEVISIWMKLDESLLGVELHLVHHLHRGMRSNEHPKDKLVPILLEDCVEVRYLGNTIYVMRRYLLGTVQWEDIFDQLQTVNTV